MSGQSPYARMRADVDRLSAELATLTPEGPRPYRPWLHLSTAERAAEVYFTAERNRVAGELRTARERLAEFERARDALPLVVFCLWAPGRYGDSTTKAA